MSIRHCWKLVKITVIVVPVAVEGLMKTQGKRKVVGGLLWLNAIFTPRDCYILISHNRLLTGERNNTDYLVKHL